jgi:hypothetical protein
MLPKIDVPIYDLILPLSKKNIKFRPFLVKEEKILLMAVESQDDNAINLAIKQILNNCCITEINIDDLPILDLEFFFLNLRARSIGELIELQYKCNNIIPEKEEDDKTCGNQVKLSFNALEVTPEIEDNHSNKIQLTDKLGLMMKYPSFTLSEKIKGLDEIEGIIKIIVSCVDYIYDDETLYYSKDISEKEMIEFIDSLTREQFTKVQEFFETIPKLKKDLKFICGKCKYEETLILEGIQSFFV